MPHADFVHLRVHSAYSLSEGAIKAEKIPALALEARMPAVAITDTANLFGALEFSQACVAKGIQPIMGCQVALAREVQHLPARHQQRQSRARSQECSQLWRGINHLLQVVQHQQDALCAERDDQQLKDCPAAALMHL